MKRALTLASLAALVSLAVHASRSGGEDSAPAMAGGRDGRARAASPPGSDPAECAECHRDEYEAWRESGHARAFTSELFAEEYALRQNAWCRDCHAPAAAALAPSDVGFSALAEVGVGCASCHRTVGGRLGATSVSSRAPHASFVDAELSTPAVCARCHQFSNPRTPELLIQQTIDEHEASERRDTPCQSCHMGDAGHRLVGLDDAALRRSSLEVTARAERVGEGARLTLTLRSRAGHAVPTGDVGRRLEVSARSGDARAEVRLGRMLRARGGQFFVQADTRVPATGEREVVLNLSEAGAPIRWQVDLLALPLDGAHEVASARGERHPLLEGAVRVAPQAR